MNYLLCYTLKVINKIFMKILIRVVVTALAVILASKIVPGIEVASFPTAILVAIVLGLLNMSLGFVLKVLTFPLTILTFGLFSLVVNGLVFWSASFVKGFHVEGFLAAFFGAILTTIFSMIGKQLTKTE